MNEDHVAFAAARLAAHPDRAIETLRLLRAEFGIGLEEAKAVYHEALDRRYPELRGSTDALVEELERYYG